MKLEQQCSIHRKRKLSSGLQPVSCFSMKFMLACHRFAYSPAWQSHLLRNNTRHGNKDLRRGKKYNHVKGDRLGVFNAVTRSDDFHSVLLEKAERKTPEHPIPPGASQTGRHRSTDTHDSIAPRYDLWPRSFWWSTLCIRWRWHLTHTWDNETCIEPVELGTKWWRCLFLFRSPRI